MKIIKAFVFLLLVVLLTACDLVVRSDMMPSCLVEGVDATFSAEVRNRGYGRTKPSVLEFELGGEAVSPTFDIPPLRRGETHTVQRQWTASPADPDEESYQFSNYITVDVNKDVWEIDEGNNRDRSVITVWSRRHNRCIDTKE